MNTPLLRCVLLLVAITTLAVASSVIVEDTVNNVTLVVDEGWNTCNPSRMLTPLQLQEVRHDCPQAVSHSPYVRYECSKNGGVSETIYDKNCVNLWNVYFYVSGVSNDGITITCKNYTLPTPSSSVPEDPGGFPQLPEAVSAIVYVLSAFVFLIILGLFWSCKVGRHLPSSVGHSKFIFSTATLIFYVTSAILGIGTWASGVNPPWLPSEELPIWIMVVWTLINVSAWLVALSMCLTWREDPSQSWWQITELIDLGRPDIIDLSRYHPNNQDSFGSNDERECQKCCAQTCGRCCLTGVKYPGLHLCLALAWQFMMCNTPEYVVSVTDVSNLTYPYGMSEVKWCALPMTSHLLLCVICFCYFVESGYFCCRCCRDRDPDEEPLLNPAVPAVPEIPAVRIDIDTEELSGMAWTQADRHYHESMVSPAVPAVPAIPAKIDIVHPDSFLDPCAGYSMPSAPPASPHVAARQWHPLPPGKEFHFFLCHHQGSAADTVAALQGHLEQMGYRCWRDNDQKMEQRDIPGMCEGVRTSCCVLLFYSGRFERRMPNGESIADTANGSYESPFTRWFCHLEMLIARSNRVPVVVVKEENDRFNRPNRGRDRDRLRELTGGWDFSTYSNESTQDVVNGNLTFLSRPSIPFRRQEHEQEALLAEVERQAFDAN